MANSAGLAMKKIKMQVYQFWQQIDFPIILYNLYVTFSTILPYSSIFLVPQ